MGRILYKLKNRVFYRYFVLIFLFISACQKEPKNTTQGEFLVDYNLKAVYDLSVIKTALRLQQFIYPDIADIVDHAKYSVQVYRISYKTHYRDSTVTASGLACIPIADIDFPIISFQNGTNTDHDNAPSVNPANVNYTMMEYMASNGYIVLMTDYIGFGASAEILHPYYQRNSTNNAVIDLIYAFDELNQRNDKLAKDNDTVYLMGYSQGGWATMSALDQIEQDNPSSFEVIAASCGAGAYDLMSMSNYVLSLETFPGPLYLPYFIYSQQVYGNITDPLSKFFHEPYAGLIPEIFDGSYNNDEVNSRLTNTISDLLTTDMLANFASGTAYSQLRELLSENSVTGWNTAAKVNIYHGTSDMNVPPEQSEELYNGFINSGAGSDQVKYFELDGYTHETGLLPWGISTINWFNALENK